jgi:PAS domain S-box-containing protein
MTADAELLKGAVKEVARLLQADGAMIYLVDEAGERLRFAHDAGITDRRARQLIRDLSLPVGVGMFGSAVAERALTVTDDYGADKRFEHSPVTDEIANAAGMRSMAVTPLIANDRVIGAMGAYSSRPAAFSEAQIRLLRALGDHAATAIANRQQAAELAHRIETQQTLQMITARVTASRDPAEILQQVVDGAKRLLGSDGAHLTLRDPERPILRPYVIAGGVDDATRDWLSAQEFPIGGGMNGLAAEQGEAVWTNDYLVDPRIPHTEDDQDVARRMVLRGMAVAPLRAPEGEILGTLAVSYEQPHDTPAEEVVLLQGLADIGAVAISNARLYEQLRDSERRYRHLVDNSPDLIWSVDADGTFTYLGDALERMTGFKADELRGKNFQILSSPETAAVALQAWRAMQERPDEEQQVRLDLPLAGGGSIPAEISMVATVVNGEFAGAHGSVRDIRERERLEQDLRRQAAAIAANEERANLARELHDSVTQALFSMGLTTRALELLLDRDPAAVREKLHELQDLQKDALAEMRTLIFELRPQGLEKDGLARALRNHAAAVQGRTGLGVAIEVEAEERLPLDIEEAFYRVAQEGLHNVVKHANATQARISLRRVGRQLRLTVEDDGVGFDPAAVARGHLGLVGMQQRAERIGGELEIGSRAGRGTRVRLTLNLRGGRGASARARAVPATAE